MLKKIIEKLYDKTDYHYVRYKCTCCGYPTLDSEGEYDICIICNWEDDGQGDYNADEVLGGLNGKYSLTQARENFKEYLCMYESGEDMRITGGDTKEEIDLKNELIIEYKVIKNYTNLPIYKKEYKKILKLELREPIVIF
ncbi:MAG: hypothetical protein ACI8WT_003824 [Clostridium sp.]|jgi:hypothetical protein